MIITKNRRFTTISEFMEIAKDHNIKIPSSFTADKKRSFSLGEIKEVEFPESPFLLKRFIKPGQFTVIEGERKCSKSFLASDICACIASGGSFSDKFNAQKPSEVCLIDAEMPISEIQNRLIKIQSLYKNKTQIDKNFNIIPLSEKNQEFNLLKSNDQDWLQSEILNTKVIVLDNLGLLMPGAELNSNTWRQAFRWIKKINKLGIAVILVHHKNKAGTMRGTGKIADDADLVISLNRPENWKPTDGNKVEFHFQAARYLHGDDVQPFMFEYSTNKDGSFKRTVENLISDEIVSEDHLSEDEKKRHEIEVAILKDIRKKRFDDDIKQNDKYIQKKDISDIFQGVSDSTFTKHFNILIDDKLIHKTGNRKGTKYWDGPAPNKLT